MVNRVDLPIDISVRARIHKISREQYFDIIVIHRTFSKKIYLKYFLGKMFGHNSYAMNILLF